MNYHKRINNSLFQDLEKHLNVENCQNYIPIYNKNFQLNNTNYNNVNLDNINYIVNVFDVDNKLQATIKDLSENEMKVDIFFKLSPLLDPVKYAIGKYDISDVNLLELPSFMNKNSHAKSRDMNNSAYVDGFFSYLSSKLLNKYNFIHGLDYYGSFLGTKNNFVYNATDEVDLIVDSKFFHDHKNKLFIMDEKYTEININNESRKYKSKLQIDDVKSEISDFDIIDLNEISTDILNNKENNEQQTVEQDAKPDIEFEENNEFGLLVLENINDLNNSYVKNSKSISKTSTSSCSDCSSRTSHTNTDEDEFSCSVFTDDDDDDADDDVSYETIDDDVSELSSNDESNLTTSTLEDEEQINLTINKFPVSIICLEKCKDTLDAYMVDNDISVDEWSSILMQVIMTLISYQKVFNLTHNDLHTNNIMYVDTNKKFLYYKFNDLIYKVPTFGKIYKIIDFGRAIYKFNDFTYCSDSFHKNGDASTQYNFEPYMNNKKPRLEPNYSFDLCRLACSMYDVIVYDQETNDVTKLIEEWSKDDKGRNVLYKTNGDERYPDFKLYKMIARTVHKHTPQEQLKREMFSKYLVSKHKLSKSNKLELMDIDVM
jgi:hypothetical protein